MARIYLSSTYSDLVDHRERVCRALRSVGHDVTLMEEYTATDKRPVDKCLQDVKDADIYIGVFGKRYGYVPDQPEDMNPDGLSITELEYRQAKSQEDYTSCLVFLSDDNYAQFPDKCKDAYTKENPPEKIERLRTDLGKCKTTAFFRNADDLASRVQAAVSNKLNEGHAVASGTPTARSQAVSWPVDQGPPYPGLMHYDETFAPVFFGRELETRELLNRLCEPGGRFLIVSGASGCGKSSLLDAGVLEHVRRHGLPGADTVSCVRMVPSWPPPNAFAALLTALGALAARARLDPAETTHELSENPDALPAVFDRLFPPGQPGEEILLFVDQFEELFAGEAGIAGALLNGLFAATQAERLWVVATIRSDQLQPLYEHDGMRKLLGSRAHYCLGPVMTHALRDLIIKPAACAGVEVPPGLLRKLLEDVDREPGSLPLLAFALRRLFDLRSDGRMSEAGYDNWGGESLGRLAGAIAEHADQAEIKIAKRLKLESEELRVRLTALFPLLVRVDLEGAPLRRAVALADLVPGRRDVALALADERLLVTGRDNAEDAGPTDVAAQGQSQSMVSIVHERLFTAWPGLAAWIDQYRSVLMLLRRAEFEAADWQSHQYDPELLWPASRLRELQAALQSLPERPISRALQRFAMPQRTLLSRLRNPALDHTVRHRVGGYLSELGDPRPGVGCRDGLPFISWVDIDGGRVELEDGAGAASVAAFRIARYPVTNAQFQAFVDADDGYKNQDWWHDMPAAANQGPSTPSWSEANAPRETVSWYESVAFCRWLSACREVLVDLPTEFEWELAATGGDPGRVYPWGEDWGPGRCNSAEANLNRTSVVGLYPHRSCFHGPLDMAGNVWEWCLNKYEKPTESGVDDSVAGRVLRSGSWLFQGLRSASRNYCGPPDFRNGDQGFRVVCRPRRP